MGRFSSRDLPPRDPRRRGRREFTRQERQPGQPPPEQSGRPERAERQTGPFDRMIRPPQRNVTPYVVGGALGLILLVVLLVFGFSRLFGGGDGKIVAQAAGITGRSADFPDLPPTLSRASEDFVKFEVESSAEDVTVNLGLPLRAEVRATGLGFYTFTDGRWQRLADATVVSPDRYTADGCTTPVTPPQGGRLIACADFSPVPANLAVLAGGGQTYQLAGSILSDSSINPEISGLLNIVNPIDYRPAADGGIQGQASQLQLAAGQRLVPTISGSSRDDAAAASDIMQDQALRRVHIDSIVSLAQQGNLAGIDLEYTALNRDARSGFTAFVQELSTALHQNNRILSVTLPASSNDSGAYDWKAIGAVADIVKVLPFPDPAGYWEAMPKALEFARSQVDSRKLLLVISPYSASKTGGQTKPIGYQEALQLATKLAVRSPAATASINPGTRVELAATNLADGQGSGLRWSDDARMITFAYGGERGTVVFIENSFSLNFKLELAQAYGLGGISLLDASALSDTASIWATVRSLAEGANVTPVRPNGSVLIPRWEAPDGGNFAAASGPVASWTAPSRGGVYTISLIISDGQFRFGRQLQLTVGEPAPTPTPAPSPTPEPTSTPEPTPTPTPTPTATAEPTPTPTATVEPTPSPTVAPTPSPTGTPGP